MSLFKAVTVGGVRVDPNVSRSSCGSAVVKVAGNPLTRTEVEELRAVLEEVLER